MFNGFYCLFLIRLTLVCAGSNYFETYLSQPPKAGFGRNALKIDKYKWPGAVIPYTFHDEISDFEKLKITNAMKIFHEKTCVKLIPKQSQHIEHIKFYKSAGCGSSIGYRTNRIEPLEVYLSPYCLRLPGAIQHELIHVMGIIHEQCRTDRDEHITVLWDNIEPKFRINFNKATNELVDSYGLPYDFDSLMHYPTMAFAKPHMNQTMYATHDPKRTLGQTKGPTFYDLEKIRRMYSCESKN